MISLQEYAEKVDALERVSRENHTLRLELAQLKAREAPEQAWARAATLMRSMIQAHGKIPDDDPVWGVEIPEYRPPEPA